MSDKEDLGRVKIYKFDPEVDEEPRYETFEVSYKGRTVLNVLQAVYTDMDPGLAFRYGCEGKHDSRCGACVIQVNGRSALSCRKISEKDMVLEPHPKFEIIKDLVVDFNRIRTEVAERTAPVTITIDPEKCIKCADCITLCPVGVYEAVKGEIQVSGAQFCCGDTCKQCVTYCQAGAITVEEIG